jgi:hypothetical protein
VTRGSRPLKRGASGARRYVPLVVGIVLVGLGSLVGADTRVADAVLRGPIVVRAALTGLVSLLGVWLLVLAVTRLAGSDNAQSRPVAPGQTPQRPFADMIRGIRLAFLAVAAFAAASAFLVGHLLPLVVGLIIAGVDVAETALLLLVAGKQRGDEPSR